MLASEIARLAQVALAQAAGAPAEGAADGAPEPEQELNPAEPSEERDDEETVVEVEPGQQQKERHRLLPSLPPFHRQPYGQEARPELAGDQVEEEEGADAAAEEIEEPEVASC